MTSDFVRIEPVVFLDTFLALAYDVADIIGTNGSIYRVHHIEQDTMYLVRVGTGDPRFYPLDLLRVYEAYAHLEEFSAAAMRQYIPDLPAAARALLLQLDLLEIIG